MLKETCEAEIRELQQTYFGYGYADIPWNFFIGGDGSVYEGRGIRYLGEIPVNDTASSFNDIGLLVAFVGTFSPERPNERQVAAFNTFLRLMTSQAVLLEDFTLLSQDQLVMTQNVAAGLLDVLDDNKNFYSRKF